MLDKLRSVTLDEVANKEAAKKKKKKKEPKKEKKKAKEEKSKVSKDKKVRLLIFSQSELFFQVISK